MCGLGWGGTGVRESVLAWMGRILGQQGSRDGGCGGGQPLLCVRPANLHSPSSSSHFLEGEVLAQFSRWDSGLQKMKLLAQGYTAWACSLCILLPLRLSPSERVQRALLSSFLLATIETRHGADHHPELVAGVGTTEGQWVRRGSLRSPVVGLRAACPHVLADPTSLPNISGHQAHSDPQAFPARVIQVPFLLLLTPGVILTLLPVTLSLTPPHHSLSRP